MSEIPQLDPEQEAALKAFFEARNNARLWKKEEDNRRVLVAELFGEVLNNAATLANQGGEYVGKVRVVPGKKLDVKRLKAERPDIYAQFEIETEQVRLEEPK